MPAKAKAARKPNFDDFQELLTAKREELVKRLRDRRAQISADHEGEDEGDLALESVIKDLALANMELEIRMLAEVDLALRLLQSGAYGQCGSCGIEIPRNRLLAIPWTRVCVACAGGARRSFADSDDGPSASASENYRERSTLSLH